MVDARKLADPHQQAKWFERVREAHQTETAEDYVEIIADLIRVKGEARVTDLSQRVAVSHATVNKVITRLKKEGLVISEPYRSIFLTEKGKEMAKKCAERRDLIVKFLMALGVDQKTADMDTEGIEHHLSDTTLEAFRKFIKE